MYRSYTGLSRLAFNFLLLNKIIMSFFRTNELESIFQLFLGFLSPSGVDLLLENIRGQHTVSTLSKVTSLMNASTAELKRLIEGPGDEEDKVMYLGVFLWRQNFGSILKELRVSYEFEFWYDATLIHRQMVFNGYENIDRLPLAMLPEEGVTTYLALIEKYLGFHKKQIGYDEDDYFSFLTTVLSVMGPTIQSNSRVMEIVEFVDYIIENIETDQRLNWLRGASFTMLVYDLGISPEKSWAAYKKLVQSSLTGSMDDFITAFLGIRMYGDAARSEWRHKRILGGFELLDSLVKCY